MTICLVDNPIRETGGQRTGTSLLNAGLLLFITSPAAFVLPAGTYTRTPASPARSRGKRKYQIWINKNEFRCFVEEWKIISGFKNFSIGCLGVLEDVCRTFYNLNGNDNKLRASKPLYLRSQLKLQSTQEIRNIMRGETTFYNRASIFCIIWPVELHKKVFNFPNLLFYWMLSTNNELSSTFCHLGDCIILN